MIGMLEDSEAAVPTATSATAVVEEDAGASVDISMPEARPPGPAALRPPYAWVRPLIIALALALGLYALLFVIHAIRLAFAPGEIAFTEATWLLAAMRVRHNLSPYFDYSQPPYIPMVYPPFVPGLAGA